MPDDITNLNGAGADTTWQQNPSSDTPAWWADKKSDTKSDADLVPSRRLKEEADKRRELESKVKEYETQEAERERKNLEKQGKFKELLDDANKKIETLTQQTQVITEYETVMSTAVDAELHTIKSNLWEEKFNKISSLLSLETLTPLQKLQALPKLKELVTELADKKPEPKGGHSIAQHDNQAYDKAKSNGDFNGLLSSIIGSAIKK